ncbi:MAG: choice-of-anchor B family protein, partial [Bacteroidota bacterium]
MRTLLLLSLLILPGSLAAQEAVTASCSGGTALSFPCSDVDLVGRLTTSQLNIRAFSGTPRGNDIWGWTDPETGVEYALVGTTEGTVFVSLADPVSPRVVGTLASATGTSTWRDLKTHGNYVYIV